MCPSLLASPTDALTLEGTGASLSPCSRADARLLGAGFAGMLPWSKYPFSATALETYLAGSEPGAPRYCLRFNDEACGALGLRLNWLRGPYIQFLGLLPAHQDCGLGGAVLSRVIADARANGDRNVWVAASAFNTSALRFYERHGFARAALIDGLVQDGIDEILLRLRI